MELYLITDALIAIVISIMVIKMKQMHKGLSEIMQYVLYKDELEKLQKSRKKVDASENPN
jgi:uncharacterized membrane protein